MAGSSEDKPLPPSEKKLRDAREKGQLPKSKEFVTAAATLAAVGLVAGRSSEAFVLFASVIRSTGELLNQPLAIALPMLSAQLAVVAANIVGPLLGLLVISAVVASVASTGGPVFSLDPLIPKPQNFNPAAGLKKLVSVRGLIEILKSLVKLVLIVVIAAHSIRAALAALVELPYCGLKCAAPLLRATLTPLVGGSLVVLLVFGVSDLLLQRWLFRRDMRMSLTEKKNEHKNTEGNPQIRNAHRRERKAASNIRAGLHEATFVVAGSQLAVAMRFSKVDTRVPIAVSKASADEVLNFIREARRLKLPIVHDPGTARLVFEQVAIGTRISRELYPPVINCMNQANAMAS